MAGVMEEVWPSENRGQGRRSGEEAVDQKQSKEVQACRVSVGIGGMVKGGYLSSFSPLLWKLHYKFGTSLVCWLFVLTF